MRGVPDGVFLSLRGFLGDVRRIIPSLCHEIAVCNGTQHQFVRDHDEGKGWEHECARCSRPLTSSMSAGPGAVGSAVTAASVDRVVTLCGVSTHDAAHALSCAQGDEVDAIDWLLCGGCAPAEAQDACREPSVTSVQHVSNVCGCTEHEAVRALGAHQGDLPDAIQMIIDGELSPAGCYEPHTAVSAFNSQLGSSKKSPTIQVTSGILSCMTRLKGK
jgi:NACalpha-BTF3-like transcription factor